jgi:hypothetical protein
LTALDRAVPALRAAFDDVLALAGFAWNENVATSNSVSVLYEVLPAVAAIRVPLVAPELGDPDAPCFDLWITYDGVADAITDVTIEGASLVSMLRDLGHDQAAAAVEAATDFDRQLAAYAGALTVLFAG